MYINVSTFVIFPPPPNASLMYIYILTSWQVRPLCKAEGQVQTRPRKAQAARVYEVCRAQGAVRVARGGGTRSGSRQRKGQGKGARHGDVTVRWRETEEEEDSESRY